MEKCGVFTSFSTKSLGFLVPAGNANCRQNRGVAELADAVDLKSIDDFNTSYQFKSDARDQLMAKLPLLPSVIPKSRIQSESCLSYMDISCDDRLTPRAWGLHELYV